MMLVTHYTLVSNVLLGFSLARCGLLVELGFGIGHVLLRYFFSLT